MLNWNDNKLININWGRGVSTVKYKYLRIRMHGTFPIRHILKFVMHMEMLQRCFKSIFRYCHGLVNVIFLAPEITPSFRLYP